MHLKSRISKCLKSILTSLFVGLFNSLPSLAPVSYDASLTFVSGHDVQAVVIVIDTVILIKCG